MKNDIVESLVEEYERMKTRGLDVNGLWFREALILAFHEGVKAAVVEILDTKLEQGVFYNHTDAHGALNKAADNVKALTD